MTAAATLPGGEMHPDVDEAEPVKVTVTVGDEKYADEDEAEAAELDIDRELHTFWCDAAFCVLIWAVGVLYALTWLIEAIGFLSWVIYLDIPLYLAYLTRLKCACRSQTFKYLAATSTAAEAKRELQRLYESAPSVTWEVQHAHYEKTKSGTSTRVTHSETREIAYARWQDFSTTVNWADCEHFALLKLCIECEHHPVRCTDDTSNLYYQDAKLKTVELTAKKDKFVMLSERVSIEDEKSLDKRLCLVQLSNDSRLNWKYHPLVYVLCTAFAASFVYDRWLEKQCIRRRVVLCKVIGLDQKFPYCFKP